MASSNNILKDCDGSRICVLILGISEMYKTPVTKRRQRAIATENITKTPVGDLNKSVVEPSVLNTPEEPGKVFSQYALNI